jgi:hypothetical protein
MSIRTNDARDRHRHAYTVRVGFDVSSRQLGREPNWYRFQF